MQYIGALCMVHTAKERIPGIDLLFFHRLLLIGICYVTPPFQRKEFRISELLTYLTQSPLIVSFESLAFMQFHSSYLLPISMKLKDPSLDLSFPCFDFLRIAHTPRETRGTSGEKRSSCKTPVKVKGVLRETCFRRFS